MLINQKTTGLPISDSFIEGVIYINSGQWLLAYAIFNELISNAKSPTASMLYNMALCHFFAAEYSKAISTLCEALQKISSSSSSQLSNQRNALPASLWDKEYQNNLHYFAVTESIFSLNSALIKLRIRRLLIDVNLKTENWQEVTRLSSFPDMEKCKNVIEALAIAKKIS